MADDEEEGFTSQALRQQVSKLYNPKIILSSRIRTQYLDDDAVVRGRLSKVAEGFQRSRQGFQSLKKGL